MAKENTLAVAVGGTGENYRFSPKDSKEEFLAIHRRKASSTGWVGEVMTRGEAVERLIAGVWDC